MNVNYKKIGERIRKIRKQRKVSQEKLAELTEYSITHISHIETGSTKASIDAILRITTALDCTPNDILCDNIHKAKPIFTNHIVEQISDCSEYETRVISDVVTAVKQSLRTRSDFFSN